MDTLLLILHGVVVLGAIYLGVREGGLGLGIWGLAGVLAMVYVFRVDPGSPPVDAVFIVVAVITAASALRITERDVPRFITQHDVIHVGGGNTANMPDVWRRQGVHRALRDAWEAGAVMTGGSAGGLCWFEGGTTDSFSLELKVLVDGLNFVPCSSCPH